MQQILDSLTQLATLAGQKNLPETLKQFTDWRDQIQLLGSAGIHPVLRELITKAIASVQATLQREDLRVTDAELEQECQAQMRALFESFPLINEAAKQFRELDQANERAQINQKYADQKRNEARKQFNEYLARINEMNALDAAALRDFNDRIRIMLKNDFMVKHLPRTAQQPIQPESMAQAPAIQNVMSAFSSVMDSANRNDPEHMKNAVSSFVGFLIDMLVESIATLCRTFAPTIAPFIGQMAQLAKGVFGHLFNSGIETAATTPVQPTREATQRPSTIADHPSVPSTISSLLNAGKTFVQKYSRPNTQGEQPNPAAIANHLPTSGLMSRRPRQ